MTRGEDMTLVDRWEELGQEHRLVESVQHDAWPRTTCWTRFLSGCSCGTSYPVISATETEIRYSTYLHKYRETHSHAEHLKHLVQILLDEDWLRIDEVERDYVPIEQA